MHSRIENVQLSRLVDGPWKRESGSVKDLVESFAGVGQLHNIVCRVRPDGKLEVLAGARRVRAARKAGLGRIDARLLEVDDAQAEAINLTENVQRKQLEPAAQRAALQRLAKLLGGRGHGGDRRSSGRDRRLKSPAAQLASITGKSERTMRSYLASAGTTRREPREIIASRLRQSLRIAQRCLEELGELGPLRAEVRAAISKLSKAAR